ncbi:MAG: cysteine hydrolase family protein [Candidatus Methylacidiphilales bacterium]|nr:isochorismatase family cysteine hydrolase [Candidatus Methylacidiphilales bacterium]
MASPTSEASHLHGNVKDRSSVVLLLVDVINHFDFPGSEDLLAEAEDVAPQIALLAKAARQKDVPVIYANDNFGRWRSNFESLIEECSEGKGAHLVKPLLPLREDYFVLKPKNSAFYATTLDLLLRHIGAQTIILAGYAGNNCILFTAHDAYLRDYKLVIPRDCVCSESKRDNDDALRHMQDVLKAETGSWKKLNWSAVV